MITKAHIKRKIDRMPNEFSDKVCDYVDFITSPKKRTKKNHTYKFKGQFDDVVIRGKAYE